MAEPLRTAGWDKMAIAAPQAIAATRGHASGTVARGCPAATCCAKGTAAAVRAPPRLAKARPRLAVQKLREAEKRRNVSRFEHSAPRVRQKIRFVERRLRRVAIYFISTTKLPVAPQR